jgi:hypothetical protein
MSAIETVAGGRAWPAGRIGGVRRVPVYPAPVGPGRPAALMRRPSLGHAGVGLRAVAGASAAGRMSAARPVAVRPARRVGVAVPVPRWRAVVGGLLVAVLAAVAVVSLGLLADAARSARVPSATALVRVEVGESLWQVARRAAPSADPEVVAARIVELNDLGSPSVRPGQVLLSPIG